MKLSLTLTLFQRMQILGTLRQKCRGKAKDSKRVMAKGIYKMLKLPDEEALKYEIAAPSGQVMYNMVAIKQAKSSAFELSAEQLRFLDEVLADLDNLGPEDDDWYEPLLESISQTLNPKPELATA